MADQARKENEEEKVRALYDSVAKSYNDAVQRTAYIGPQWLLDHVQDVIQGDQPAVLDLGCANGINVANLKRLNPTLKAVGVDISPNMIAEARQTGLYDALYSQSLDHGLGFCSSASCDLVLALGCLEFLNDLDRCLTEISRVCRPGGTLFASFQRFEEGNPLAPRQSYSGDVRHFAYSTAEVAATLEQAGFVLLVQEERVGYTGGYPCPYLFVKAQKQEKIEIEIEIERMR